MNLTKSLDPTRPVTFVTSQIADNDKAVSNEWNEKSDYWIQNTYARTADITGNKRSYVCAKRKVWKKILMGPPFPYYNHQIFKTLQLILRETRSDKNEK